jgi:excisionase family DNA binding protein
LAALRDGHHAGHLVGVLPLGAVDDLRQERAGCEGKMTDKLLTVEEAAVRLGTSVRFVRRLIGARRIVYIRVGRHVRIAEADLAGFVAAGRIEASA